MHRFLWWFCAVFVVSACGMLYWIGQQWIAEFNRQPPLVQSPASIPETPPAPLESPADPQHLPVLESGLHPRDPSEEPLKPLIDPTDHAQILRNQAEMMAKMDAIDKTDRYGGPLSFPTDPIIDLYAYHLREISRRMDRTIVKVSNIVELMIEDAEKHQRTTTRLELLSGLDVGTDGLPKDVTLEEFAAAATIVFQSE